MSGPNLVERVESVNSSTRESVFTEVILPVVLRYSPWFFQALKRKDDDSFEDSQAGAMAHAWELFLKALDAGKDPRSFPSSIAAIACRLVRRGRKVGTSENVRCTLRAAEVGRTRRNEQWVEAIAESRAPIPDQVAFRVDFPEWLDSLSARDREVALELATGTPTQDCAAMFSVTPGRVSQLRRELMESWEDFTQ
jgi:hypothetical protein